VHNDVRKRVGGIELDFLPNSNRLRLNAVPRGVHEAADVASEFLDEQA
jgi:hypothetical protein